MSSAKVSDHKQSEVQQPLKINLMIANSRLDVGYVSEQPLQPSVLHFDLMRPATDDGFFQGDENHQARECSSQLENLDEGAELQPNQPRMQHDQSNIDPEIQFKRLAESHFETKAMPESLKAKLRAIDNQDPSLPPEGSKRKSKTASLLAKVVSFLPSILSPKKVAHEYSSLEKQPDDDQAMVEIHTPREMKIQLEDSQARGSLQEQKPADKEPDESEDAQMAALFMFLDELGPNAKAVFVQKMILLGQQPNVTKSQFEAEVARWLAEMQLDGVIQRADLLDSIESLYRPMSRLFSSVRLLAESDAVPFPVAFNTAIQNISELKSPSLFLNPKFIAIRETLSKKRPEQFAGQVQVPQEFVQARDALPIFVELMLVEASISKDSEEIQEELKEFRALITKLSDTRDLFFNPTIADTNYVTRDKLLYRPVLKLCAPKPRQPLVYYRKQYTPLIDNTSYGLSKLFKPFTSIIKKLNFLKPAKKEEPEQFQEAVEVELSDKKFETILSLTTKVGIKLCLTGFQSSQMISRFEQSFNEYKDKTNMQKLPSYFVDRLVRHCLVPSTFLNFDLTLYKVHLALYDSIIKLQCLTLLCRRPSPRSLPPSLRLE